jgi:hypothetical protein
MSNGEPGSRPDNNDNRKWLILAILSAVTAIAVAWIGASAKGDAPSPAPSPPSSVATPATAAPTTPPRPTGRIVSPKGKDQVSEAIDTEVVLSGIPSDHHVWLAVYYGNLYYVKEPELPSGDGTWPLTIYESGSPPGKFSLSLLMVDGTGQKQITDRLAQHDYGGVPSVAGSVSLNTVSGLTLAPS